MEKELNAVLVLIWEDYLNEITKISEIDITDNLGPRDKINLISLDNLKRCNERESQRGG